LRQASHTIPRNTGGFGTQARPARCCAVRCSDTVPIMIAAMAGHLYCIVASLPAAVFERQALGL